MRRPGRRSTGLEVPRVGVDWNEGGIGAGIADLDNDGRQEILLGASDYADQYLWVFLQQPDRTFREVGAQAGLHHACAPSFSFADLDRDGDLDLVVTSSIYRDCQNVWTDGPPVRIYENLTGQDANWTQIHLEGAGASVGGANRRAIGAVVRVTAGGVTRTREVQGGYGHFGMQHDLDVTVGLGDTCEIDAVEVCWPDDTGSSRSRRRRREISARRSTFPDRASGRSSRCSSRSLDVQAAWPRHGSGGDHRCPGGFALFAASANSVWTFGLAPTQTHLPLRCGCRTRPRRPPVPEAAWPL